MVIMTVLDSFHSISLTLTLSNRSHFEMFKIVSAILQHLHDLILLCGVRRQHSYFRKVDFVIYMKNSGNLNL